MYKHWLIWGLNYWMYKTHNTYNEGNPYVYDLFSRTLKKVAEKIYQTKHSRQVITLIHMLILFGEADF